MAKTNSKDILQETKDRMQEMIETKAKDMEAIKAKQAEANEKAEAAKEALQAATEAMNLQKYTEAENELKAAQTAASMYGARFQQLAGRAFISEADSDAVIDSLLQYEKDLEAKFRKDIAAPIKQLEELVSAYFAVVADTEATMENWTANIHPNFRSMTTTYEKTGTNRAPHPIPVRVTAYYGCQEANQVDIFLKNAQTFKKE